MVYVISQDNKPLTPCSNPIARLLLKQGKAKHTFEFETDDDWIPGECLCWVECPFSPLIGLGRSCFFKRREMDCPFKK